MQVEIQADGAEFGAVRRTDRRGAVHPTRVDCSVVVVTHNSRRHVGPFLASLPAAAPGLLLRVIVVDSGSSDDTLQLLNDRPDVHCIVAGPNRGYAAGINAGRARADRHAPVVVLNPDVRLEPLSLQRLLDALHDDARVGVAVPRVHDSVGRCARSLRREPSLTRAIGDALFGSRWCRRPGWLSEMVCDDESYAVVHDVDWAAGAAFAVAPGCDERLGPWSEAFFLYSEEVDYCARARDAGFVIRYVPDAVVVHEEGGSGRSDSTAALMALNRVRYFRLRHPASSTALFRAVVILHEALRASDPGHRQSVRVLLSPERARRLLRGMARTV